MVTDLTNLVVDRESKNPEVKEETRRVVGVYRKSHVQTSVQRRDDEFRKYRGLMDFLF